MKVKISFLVFVFVTLSLFSNLTPIDSLSAEIGKTKGKKKVNLMLKLSTFQKAKDFHLAEQTALRALSLSDSLKYEFGKSEALKILGDIYYDQENFKDSFDNYRRSIEIKTKIKDMSGLAYCYRAIGSLYLKQTNYKKAIENLFKSLEYYQKSENFIGSSGTLNNIGLVYKEIKEYDKALNYFFKALETAKETKDEYLIGRTFLNIGSVYKQKGNINEALRYYEKSLESSGKIGDKSGIALCYNNIGNIFSDQKKFDKALRYYLKSLKIKKELHDSKSIAYTLLNIGNLYLEKGNINTANRYFFDALNISKELNLKEIRRDVYLGLSRVNQFQKKYYSALNYFQKYSALKDSIMNENISVQIANIQTKYETEKKEKEIEIYKLKLDKQKLVVWKLYSLLGIIFGIMIFMSYFYFQKNKINKKLRNEIKVRKKIEKELQEIRKELELRVKQRTKQLAKANLELQKKINEHKATEEMYRKYESIANTSKEFMTLINRNYIYEAVNDSYCKACGKPREKIIGHSVSQIWGEEQFENIIKKHMDMCFQGNEVHYQEWFNFSDAKRRKFYDVAYYPFYNEKKEVTHTIVVTRDVTENKLLETQLLRSERLAGIGELAAGVAHEIRNPIAIIKSTAQYCQNKFQSYDKELKELMEIFVETSDKIDKTVRKLLEFAKPQQSRMRKGNIMEILKKVCSYIEGKCAEQNIETNYEIPETSLPVLFDEDKLNGAFLNLMLNAVEAMPNGGKLSVSAVNKKDEIEIKITDTGKGISPDNQRKIFNPFFTTKKTGTGLGLSLVHQVINIHHGKINVYSKIGVGTEIILIFPVYKK